MNKSRQQVRFYAPCRFFTLFSLFGTSYLTAHKKLNRHSRLRWPALVVKAHALLIAFQLRFSFKSSPLERVWVRLPPSVEQLRTKSGKIMVAKSVMAGHSGFLLKRGARASESDVKRQQPRFCLICRAMASAAKKHFD